MATFQPGIVAECHLRHASFQDQLGPRSSLVRTRLFLSYTSTHYNSPYSKDSYKATRSLEKSRREASSIRSVGSHCKEPRRERGKSTAQRLVPPTPIIAIIVLVLIVHNAKILNPTADTTQAHKKRVLTLCLSRSVLDLSE